jgi:hypothetical protein
MPNLGKFVFRKIVNCMLINLILLEESKCRNFIKYFLNLGLYTILKCCILIGFVCMVVYCLVYLVVVVLGLLLLC